MKVTRSLKSILLILFLFFCLFLNAEKLGVLENPFKAPFIRMDDNQIYIYDNVFLEFHLYSKKTLKKISEFGSKGEGPGEFRAINHVKIKNKNIYVSNFPKVSIFSKAGKLIKELKAPTNVSYFISIADNFVGVQKFFFTVFDSEGNKLYDINRSYKRRKITDLDKKMRIKKAKEVMGEQKWKTFIIGTEISFPEYYPAYMNFEIDNGKMYVFAFPEKDTQEIFILDLKGKLIKQIKIPIIDMPGYIEHSCFCIDKGKMYYMTENEETQKWEIHYNILE
jgi:hypothetical protein